MFCSSTERKMECSAAAEITMNIEGILYRSKRMKTMT